MRAETAEKLSDLCARAGRGVAAFACELLALCDEGGAKPGGAAPQLLTAKDVAARLQTNTQTVYRLARGGKLPAVNTGRRALRWAGVTVEDFIRRGGVAADAGEEARAKPLRLLRSGR